MPDEPVPTPEPPLPEQPTLMGGPSPDEMFARGMQSVKMTSGTQGMWQPPGVEEANRLFPNYAVLGLLGRGGMGAVYKANQTSLDRLVAIKLLPLEVSVDKDFADRFVREARAMAKLNHPNIISVHDFGKTSEGHLYFVMEYVEGANLADLIHRVGLTSEQSLSIVEQVCTALAYAHGKGIVHRDVKPANVMIDTESQVKVADFGLARLTDPSAEQMGHTMTGTVMGTPDYMAPEQMKGMNVDHRADIYSLGVMVYEMLCREVPRGAFEPPSVHAGCDPRIDPIVIKAMQPNPDRRYQSTQEMRADVAAVRTPLPVPPPPPSPAGAPPSKPPMIPAKPAAPPPAPEMAVLKAITLPTAAKSKTPLYAGIAIVVVVLAAATFFFKPKSEPPANAEINTRDATGGIGSVRGGGGDKGLSEDGRAVSQTSVGADRNPGSATAPAVASKTPAGKEPWQDLLAGIKLPEDVRDNATYKLDQPGHWELREGALRLTAGRGSVVVTPATGGANYDVQFKLTRSTRAYDASVGLPAGDHKIMWQTLSKAPCGFEKIGTTDLRTGPASAPNPFEDGQPHNVLLSIRNLPNGDVSLRSTIDGQPSAQWTGPASQFSVHPSWSHQPKDRLCLGASGSTGSAPAEVVFSEVRFRTVQADTVSPSAGLAVPSHPVPTDTGGTRSVASQTSGGADRAAPTTATKDAPFENTLGMKFVPVPILGGPTGGQRVLFSVWDTRVQDYEAFVKETKRDWPKVDFEQGPTHPAVNVSWDDATAFCAWLTKREHEAGKLGANEGYRLPGDYEWSCAVGLGAAEDPADLPVNKTGKNSDLFPWGVQWPPPEKTGNYAGEELKPLLAAGKYPFIKDVISGYHDGYANTSPVGSYGANRFGLFDMGGNVQQWCEDWFDTDQKDRVLRGSSWANYGRGNLLSSFRHHYVPTIHNLFLTGYGFRCVLAPASVAAPASRPSAAGQWIELLPLVDLKRDEVRGTWSKKPDGLSLDSSFKFGVCELPYEPPEEYDFAVEFTPTSGGNNVNLHLRAGGASFIWKLNAHGRTPPIYGLDLLDGKLMPNRTEAVVTNPLRLETGQRYATRVEVRRGGLRALVNGSEVFQWSGDYQRLSTESDAQLRHPEALAIGSYGRAVIFHQAEVREITGTGKITGEPPSAAPPAP